MSDSRLEESRYVTGRLFWVAIVLVIAAPLFWRHVNVQPQALAQGYENAVLYQQVYPSLTYGFDRLKTGQLPLWDPNQACGTPFLADPASGIYQPLNLLFLILPVQQALAAHGFVCLALMGLFFTLYARSLGVRHIPALAGAITYAFSGATAAAITRPALANALVWTPLLFWALREQSRHWRWSGAIAPGIAIALLWLSGAPALAITVIGLWAVYGLYLAIMPGHATQTRLPRRLAGLALSSIVGMLAAAAQLMPAIAWAWQLDKPALALGRMDWAGLTGSDWHGAIAQLVLARPETLPHVGYLGVISLVAASAALFHKSGRRDMILLVLAGPLLLWAAAAGAQWMPAEIPRAALAAPAVFCLSALVALGMDRLLEPAVALDAPTVWAPAIAACVVGGFIFYVGDPEAQGRVIAFILVLLPFLAKRKPAATAICGAILALMSFTDLLLASQNLYRHPVQDAPACYRQYAPAVGAAQEQALDGRVLVSTHALNPALPANLGRLFPVAVAGGAEIPLTRDQARWWSRLTPEQKALSSTPTEGIGTAASESPLLDSMAVRALLAAPGSALHDAAFPAGTSRLREVRAAADVRLLVNDKALPRAYFVPGWRRVDSVEEALNVLLNPEFDNKTFCTIQSGGTGVAALEALLPHIPEGDGFPLDTPLTSAPCRIETTEPEHVVIQVEAPKAGVLVLADSFARGWKAALDGAPAVILKANGIFRGIAVPSGAHTITFRYQPLPVFIGLGISLATLSALFLMALLKWALNR